MTRRKVTSRPVTGFCVVAVLALAGCASTPTEPAPWPGPLLAAPVASELPPGGPPLVDGRAAFRAVFCAALDASAEASAGRSCDQWLWRLSDEPELESVQTLPSPEPEPTVDVVLVPGAFSECYGEDARPFADGAKLLAERGYRVHQLPVSGRSGTEHNARQIADAMAKVEFTPGRRVVLVGFSKGSNDILRMLVDFPEQARRVDAVISVGSPILGTPAADVAAGTYGALLKKLPLDACPPGDGQVLESLRPGVRAAWMAAHPLPAAVRYYSLAGFAARDRIASALVPAWRYLSEFDARNDGQVLASKAAIPGATLLGYANADHWALAMHHERQHPYLVQRQDTAPFPAEVLLAALVEFVQQDLSASRTLR